MRKLVRYLKNYKLNLTLGPLAKLTEAIFELIVPLVMSDIIDNGIDGDGGLEYVLTHGAIMVALGVLGLVCALTCQYLAAKCSQGFGTELRNDLSATSTHCLSRSWTSSAPRPSSTACPRTSINCNIWSRC